MALQQSSLQTGATIFVERHGFQLPAVYSDFAAEYIAATTSVGVAPTVTVTESLPGSPPESVTEAVIMWVPSLRVAEKLPPVPIGPTKSEVQLRLPVRVPSSVSVAVPAKLMVAPEG